METIKNYLDNLFASYPKTPEVENAKSELLNNMEDRYSELKSKGKSENEAIGIVISEFGNIDELMKELNVKSNVTVEDTVSVSGEEAKDFIEAKRITFRQYTRYLIGVTRMLSSLSKSEESSATHCIMTSKVISMLSVGLVVSDVRS